MINPDEVPKFTSIQFPDTRIFVHCWCAVCGWHIEPTGWYDSDGSHISFQDLVDFWQGDHDGDVLRAMGGIPDTACFCDISYKILEKEGPHVSTQEDD